MQKTNNLPDYIKLNHKIRPQDDFYAYVCHRWRQDNPRPAIRSRWSLFDALNERVEKQIQKILEDWLKADNPKLTTAQQQVVIYYQTLIDKEKHQDRSLATLLETAQAIGATNSKAILLGRAANWGIGLFFAMSVNLDSKNNRRYCLNIYPAKLDLPERAYYLSRDAAMQEFRRAYLDFIQNYAQALGKMGFQYSLEPKKILAIETNLAKFSWELHKARDSEKTYNLYTWQAFRQEFSFNWPAYFKLLEIKTNQDIIVSQPSCLKKALRYLENLPINELKGYLTHKLALSLGGLLNEAMVKNYFEFFGKKLLGVEQLKPLKKRVLNSANNTFCDTFGQTYVKRHFTVAQKQTVEKLAAEVSKAFRKRLGENEWMSSSSRQYAQIKLDQIIVNIGYSGYWAEYNNLELDPSNPVRNALSINLLENKKVFALLSQKPDRRRFNHLDEDVQTVNAWTNYLLLNTNYPAAFLQVPFYNHQAGWEYNLGSIGSVIGHELTHNFDDQGSRYDQDGHLQPWLSKAEQKTFAKAAEKLIKRADKHYPTPETKMKGKQVIGEVIADLGGLAIVLDIVKGQYKDRQQRRKALRMVFIAYAFHFATNESLEAKIMMTKAAVHPDNAFRVNGVVAHCEDFYEAFEVKQKDGMYISPDERAKIW